MREIEVKVRVKDLGAITKKLAELGVQISEPLRQHDVIYALRGSAREFTDPREGDITPRIRKINGSVVEFNLKQQKTGEMDNIEYETVVQDPEAIHHILGLFGYVPHVEVTKVRRKAKIGEYEMCLDDVEGLGTFVELEKLAPEDAEPETVRKELFEALKPFGISPSDEEVHGYDIQLLLKQGNK